MKITKSELKGLIKEELLEAFGLEIPIDKKEASAPQLGLMKLKEEVDVERTSEDLLVLNKNLLKSFVKNYKKKCVVPHQKKCLVMSMKRCPKRR